MGNIKPTARAKVFKKYDYTCQGCGLVDNTKEKLTLDHKTPRSRGGTNKQSNLHVLCQPCNLEKDDMTLLEWQGNSGYAT